MWYVRPAKALIRLRVYAQSDQSPCLPLDYSMGVKVLIEHLLEVLSLKEVAHARLSLFMSKCHIVGNHMSQLQGSKIALVRSYLRVPQAAGQVKILVFLLKKIICFPYIPIIFVIQGKRLF